VDLHSELVRNRFLLVHLVAKFIFALVIFLRFRVFNFFLLRFFFFFFRAVFLVAEVAIYILISVD
jgi:hypothetical protein